MERFLSPGWFEMAARPDSSTGDADLVLEQRVTGGPDGDVAYQVSLRGGRATITVGSRAGADMTFTSDYGTATAIAAGRLPIEAALADGRIRVSGSLSRLQAAADLTGTDVFAEVRSRTSFDPEDPDATAAPGAEGPSSPCPPARVATAPAPGTEVPHGRHG